jgi:hypothetical protein
MPTKFAENSTTPPKVIHADATKDFFVTMITRDISLRDCIFDLLDNAIDGARRSPVNGSSTPFVHHKIELSFDSKHFNIKDNCGGIKLSDAIDYAFHFGRKPHSPTDVKGGIGLYGIGMKRAIFKIGKNCEVVSHASDASFKVIINVPEWEVKPSWDFEYEDVAPIANKGASISIAELNDGIAQMLGDPGFKNELVKDIARDYAFFIHQGLQIEVCKNLVPSYKFQLVTSEQVVPAVETYDDDGVSVRILVGLVDELPDDIPDELRPTAVERYGWFVICNDRVVLAADKSERTVWGDDEFKVWHPQYNGFGGFVFFSSDDQSKLPWTTTKRELDAASPLYRRAIAKMKILTDQFTKYTNTRKQDLEGARAAEVRKSLVEVSELTVVQPLKMPTLNTVSQRSDIVSISYQRRKIDVDEVKRHLGAPSMTNKDMGIKTFEYFREVELGK